MGGGRRKGFRDYLVSDGKTKARGRVTKRTPGERIANLEAQVEKILVRLGDIGTLWTHTEMLEERLLIRVRGLIDQNEIEKVIKALTYQPERVCKEVAERLLEHSQWKVVSR